MAEPPRARITVPLGPRPAELRSDTGETQQASRLGKYELVELLGQGGMAEVWLATLTGAGGFSRSVVVKRVLADLTRNAAFTQRLLREGRLSSRLNHSNIVKIFELSEEGGEYFLALDYIEGCDLSTLAGRLRGRGPMPPGLGAFVLREVCRGLAYAHSLADEQGQPLRIIHRDISPSNVMLGFDGSVKIVDFGIAKALGELGQSSPGALIGKPAYISPEQLDAKELDHRVDIWGAGVVLHELLTGRFLFRRESAIATIEAIRSFPIPSPSEQNAEVPAALDRICMKALARNRSERYRSCEEMGADLQEVLRSIRFGPDELIGLLRETLPSRPSSATPPLARTDGRAAPTTADERPAPAERLDSGAATFPQANPRGRAPSTAAADDELNELRTTAPYAAPTPEPSLQGTALASPPQRGSSLRWVGLVAALAAASAGAGIWAGRRRHAPAALTVQVRSTPPGARIIVGAEGRERGRTPLELPVARGEQLELTLEHHGYRSAHLTVRGGEDTIVEASLEKVPAPLPEVDPAPRGGAPSP